MIHISTRFFLVRHGETEWNRSDRFRGRADVNLNEVGRRQAEELARCLTSEHGPITAVLSSPLPRAMETAHPIATAFHLTVEPSADLLDIDYGGWEGLSAAEAEEKFPELYETWLKRPGRVKFPGGESTRQVRIRVENLLNDLHEQHPGESIALVSHRVTCHVALCVALGLNNDFLWRIKQDVACLNLIEKREEGYAVALLNSTCHLRN